MIAKNISSEKWAKLVAHSMFDGNINENPDKSGARVRFYSKDKEKLERIQKILEGIGLRPYKNEVDIILSNREIIPVEIKYGKLHFDGLLNFMRKFKINKGYIISFSMEGKHNFDGNNVDVIPAFKFLLRDNYWISIEFINYSLSREFSPLFISWVRP